MKNFTLKTNFLTLVILTFFPFTTQAAEIRLTANKIEVGEKEQFTVDVIIHNDETINAIEGKILFPSDLLTIKKISDGNSVINFWLEKPIVESPNLIKFSGITPGGFNGINNKLFSLTFEAEKIGPAKINLTNATALLNDGLGTKTPLTFRHATVNIRSGDDAVRKEMLKDNIPPESFTPIITRDPNLFDNKWFVVFSTSDKDSGLAYYQIKEYRFPPLAFISPWKIATSPYPLSDQELKSYLIIRAIDNSNNAREEEMPPSFTLPWYEYLLPWAIIIPIPCGILYLILKLLRKKNI